MIRPPAVAGLFYPADPGRLAHAVDELLGGAARAPVLGLRALVAPHAGYEYSGPVAASAYALMPRSARIVLLGPSHFVALDGLVVSSAAAWSTPLGDVAVDHDLHEAALGAGATVDDLPHAQEHALEVQLPFLQRACPDGLEILPIAVGRESAAELADVIAALGAFVVVSTDLSHYHDAETAKRLDRETADAVVRRAPDELAADRACGVYALRGLVEHARRTTLCVELLDLRTSADTAGGRDSVVGYGAFAVTSGA